MTTTLGPVLSSLHDLLQEAIAEGRIEDARALAVAISFLAVGGRGAPLAVDPHNLEPLVEGAVEFLVGVAADAVTEGTTLGLDPMALAAMLLRALDA